MSRLDAILGSASGGLGTIVLDNVPAYHGPATFHWTLRRKPYQPTLGVFARQNGAWVYIAELPIGRSLTGSGTVVIASEVSSALPGRIDYGQPSECQAMVWDERLVAQGKPPAMTPQVFFMIEP